MAYFAGVSELSKETFKCPSVGIMGGNSIALKKGPKNGLKKGTKVNLL